MRFDSYTDHSVRLAVDLVNTYSPAGDRERLRGLEDLGAFLEEHHVRPAAPPTDRDLTGVRAARERLRRVFEAPDEERAADALNAILGETRAHPQLADHDGEPWHLHFVPTEAPVARHLAATAAMGLAVVIAEGGFERLGTCDWERCRDVYVDTSKNRSRRYCDPAVCGNRASAAAYRRRQREATGAGD